MLHCVVLCCVSCALDHLEEDEKFWEMNELTKMDISHNEISAVDDRIRTLPSLNVLIARNNQIMQISPCISELTNLQSIDLSRYISSHTFIAHLSSPSTHSFIIIIIIAISIAISSERLEIGLGVYNY